jgi:MFS transporter, SP family, general alpha glucoside:H+ symporter
MAYRSVIVSQFGICGLSVLFLLALPESPVWFISKGKDDKARRSLRLLGWRAEEVEPEMQRMRVTLDEAKKVSEGATYLDCFRKPNLRRTVISIMPLTIQAFCGSYFVFGYGTYYMQLAGFSTSLSYKLQIVLYALAMIGNMLSW